MTNIRLNATTDALARKLGTKLNLSSVTDVVGYAVKKLYDDTFPSAFSDEDFKEAVQNG